MHFEPKHMHAKLMTSITLTVATLVAVFALATPAAAAAAPAAHAPAVATVAVRPDAPGWVSYGWYLNLATCQNAGAFLVSIHLAIYYRCDYGERIGRPSWQLMIYVQNAPHSPVGQLHQRAVFSAG